MKKALFTLVFALFVNLLANAQISGIKYIPGDYPGIAAAIAAINSSGVGSGGVTFNVNAGHTETFATATAGHITTTTGSAANPVVFQKNGSGNNPLITAPVGVGNRDAIIAFLGCDYVTFDGIDLSENASNNTYTKRMEWGYAVLKASATNGSQNITIKNCTVTLNKLHLSSTGIYCNNHLINSVAQLTVTALGGTNSNLKIFNNTIANCYFGIQLTGYNDLAEPYLFYDQNNEIGKDGANNITNVGGQTVDAYGIYATCQNNLTVANNNVSGSSTPYDFTKYSGIHLTNSKNANFDVYGNTVSLQFSPADDYGNSQFYAIWCDMGANGTNNVANFYNNTVTNCTFPTATGSAQVRSIYILNMGVIANVYGNSVTNNTIGGAPGASHNGEWRVMWIQKQSSISGPLVVHGNTVSGNSRITAAAVSASTYFLTIAGSGTTLEAYNNIVDQNVVGASGAIQCMYVTYNNSDYKNVHNNTVTNISEANGSICGLYVSAGNLSYVYQNKIQNIKSNNSATGANINGIYSGNDGAAIYFYNNMVSDLTNPASNATEGYSWNMLNGFYVDESNGIRGFYNNTVYLNSVALGSQANYGSSAFCVKRLYGIDLQNNIFVNTSSSVGANGKTVGIRARNAGFTGFTSNFNNIYTGTPGATRLIFYDGTSAAQTLANYKTLVTPQEVQSVTEMPPFVNVSVRPYNVHLQTGVATQCEAGGSVVTLPVEVINDFDGDARYPETGYPVNPSFSPGAPDIGADEFGGLTNDLTAPYMVFTPLGNTFIGLSRTLTVKMYDGTGVPASGTGLPRLYWKKNSGAYQSVQATYVSPSTYSFVFGSGASTNDVISYYLVAQDMVTTPNVGASPMAGAGGFTANPPACATPPTTPYTYSVVSSISGVFHVGIGKTYTTITQALSDLSSKFLVNQVTLVLDDETYPSETFPLILNPLSGSSATNKLVIKPNTGVTPVISGSVAGSALLKFKGIDYVVIDGSSNGGTDRSLTIENTSGEWYSYVIGITNNGSNDASTNVTIKNCIVMGNNDDIEVDTYLVTFNENGGVNGGGYNNILFENNWLKRAKSGIDISAANSNRNYNITLLNNTVGSPEPSDYITRWGIAYRYTDNMLIEGNDIMGPAQGSDAASQFGIVFVYNCTNTKITRNKIHDWISNSIGSFGIKCDNDNNSTPTEISNNEIYNIGAWGLNPGVAQSQAHGIMVRQGGNLRILNNSIYMSGPYLYGYDSYAPSSSCIAFWNQSLTNSSNYEIKNNVLRNAMTNEYPSPGPTAQGRAYGIMMTGNVSGFDFDNNDFYIDGYQGQLVQIFTQNTPPYITNFPTLASWQAYSGQDMNSVTINPEFTSGTNLLPTSTALDNKGVFIPDVTIDINGATRSNPPDMGAYEFGTAPIVHNISLPAGWSGISSYVTPVNNSMASVLSPIEDKLILINNFSGMYYPAGGIFTLSTWDDHSGYAIKLTESATLPIGTSLVVNKTVSLSQGWNLIPVLSSNPYSAVNLFSGVSGLAIVKDVAGNGVYWPAYGINSIQNLQPGKAYYVRMNNSGSITYGTDSGNPENLKPEVQANPETPWNEVINTPASHLVAFITENSPLISGDIIGGFTQDGICAGAVEISNASESFALSLNADDAATPQKEGFTTGNPLNYKLYRPSTGDTYELVVTYDPSMNTGFFENNGISAITSLKLSLTGMGDLTSGNLQVYPNPSNGLFTIQGVNENITIRVINAFGDEVFGQNFGLPAQVDISNQPKGVYFVKIETSNGVIIKKLVIQ